LDFQYQAFIGPISSNDRRSAMPWLRLVMCLACCLVSVGAFADGLSAIKDCEADNSPPEDYQRLSILPNGETRGSDTAARLVGTARQKAKEGKDDEALRWAALCQAEQKDQEAIKADGAAVLRYLKQ
jgi:hypothetical protein